MRMANSTKAPTEQSTAILGHAASLFASRGYAATSMNDVAEASSLSKATLYHYFTEKSQLLFHIADGHVSRLVEVIEEVEQRSLVPTERLRALIARFMREYEHAHHAHRVLTEDVKFLNACQQRTIVEKERRVVDAFARTIVAIRPEADATGLAKPLTMLLFGMLNWMFTWLRPNGPLTYDPHDRHRLGPVLRRTAGPGVRPPRAPRGSTAGVQGDAGARRIVTTVAPSSGAWPARRSCQPAADGSLVPRDARPWRIIGHGIPIHESQRLRQDLSCQVHAFEPVCGWRHGQQV